MFAAHRNFPSQFVTRAAFDWPVINEELFSVLSPVREALNCDAITTDAFVKQWLNLPRNCTPATVFHPDVLDLPF